MPDPLPRDTSDTTDLQPMPVLRDTRFLRVKLDMVAKCQLKCIMCHFAHPEFKSMDDVMEGELLEKVAAEVFPRSHDVVLSSSAEPLMARSLPRALELCRQYGVPWFHFSTNLMSMTHKLMEKIVAVQMPLMTVSVDGATKATFEKIRPPAKWEQFLARFDLVNEVKRATGSKTPQLSATAVLMRSNIEEMPDLVRLMRSKGVDYMNFVHMALIGGLGIEDETMLKYPALCNRMMAEVQVVANEVGMQVQLPLPLQEEIVADARDNNPLRAQEGAGNALQAPTEHASSATVAEYLNHKNREFNFKVPARDHHSRLCYFPWYYIHINPDGTVFPCGCWFEFSSFGSFATQSFKEIWTGPAYRKLRHEHLTAQFRDVCANCSVAVMGRPDVTASFSHRAKIKREKLTPVMWFSGRPMRWSLQMLVSSLMRSVPKTGSFLNWPL